MRIGPIFVMYGLRQATNWSIPGRVQISSFGCFHHFHCPEFDLGAMDGCTFRDIALLSSHQQIDIGVPKRRVRPASLVDNANTWLGHLRYRNRKRQFSALISKYDAITLGQISISCVRRMQHDLRVAKAPLDVFVVSVTRIHQPHGCWRKYPQAAGGRASVSMRLWSTRQSHVDSTVARKLDASRGR